MTGYRNSYDDNFIAIIKLWSEIRRGGGGFGPRGTAIFMVTSGGNTVDAGRDNPNKLFKLLRGARNKDEQNINIMKNKKKNEMLTPPVLDCLFGFVFCFFFRY